MSRTEVQAPPTKPSGIPWLGEVPAHWEVKRLKDMCQLSALYGMNEPSSSYATEGIRFLRTTDITDDGELLEGGAVYLEPEVVKDYMLADGDILLSRSGTLGRSLVYREGIHGPCSYAGYLVRFVPGTNLDPQFAFYFTKSREFVDWLELTATASTIGNISGQKFANLPIPSPPLPEQRAIAAFLDERTARIDALVGRKRRLVQLLKEKRQALITRAVTRGLDPTAKMKESGVPWLGEVPEGWEVKKIRFLFRFQSGGTPSTTNEAYWEGTLPWVSAKDMKRMWISDTEDYISEHALAESAANTVPPNSLLLLTRSGILQHTIPVCVNSRRMAINQDVKGFIPVAENVDVRFCAYFIHGSQDQLLPLWRQEGATVESLEFETVKNTMLPLPPLVEQRTIAAFLDDRTTRLDALVTKVEQAVERLQEYRTALISAAVTGKVRVPTGRSEDEMIGQ